MTLQKCMTYRELFIIFLGRKKVRIIFRNRFFQTVRFPVVRRYVIASSHGSCHPGLILIKIFL